MRAGLPQKEPTILAEWAEKKLYDRMIENNQGKPLYVLHDGPPYANGDIHLGTALNKVLKDMVVRSRAMDGYLAPYVPGWDCHGLPIELQALRTAGLNKHAATPLELRRRCREFALGYVDVQREEFRRHADAVLFRDRSRHLPTLVLDADGMPDVRHIVEPVGRHPLESLETSSGASRFFA
jgi:isoleucyl-tRNA synthetase